MKKLEKLTQEQLSLLPKQARKWLDIGLSTEPLDFDNAKKAVIDAYKAAGLKEPNIFFRFQSPLSAAIGAAMLKNISPLAQVGDQVRAQVRDQVGDQVGDQVWAQVMDQVGDQVMDQVGDQVRDQVGAQVGAQVYGAHDAHWLGFYETFQQLGIDTSKLNPLMELAKHCGWWAPYKNAAILQDRPEIIKFDDNNRLHCEDGPAIKYRDGFSIFSWHGTIIPGEWLAKKPSAKEALAVPNMEKRRAACEIVGWDNILNELDATSIDKDPDPQIGELLEVNIPDIGKEKFLRVTCGTGRQFSIPVPPDMKTALQSNAWTWGLEPHEYKPEVRT